jgi:hypothetical protein
MKILNSSDIKVDLKNDEVKKYWEEKKILIWLKYLMI